MERGFPSASSCLSPSCSTEGATCAAFLLTSGMGRRPGWLAIGREPIHIHSERERVRPIRRTRLAWHAYTQRCLASQPGDGQSGVGPRGWQKATISPKPWPKRKWGAERDLEETARARGMMVTGGERAGAIDLHLLQARREGQQGVRSQVRSRHLRGTSRSRISLDSANWTELDHISPIKQARNPIV